MKLTLGNCEIDIDEKATRDFYSSHDCQNDCTCAQCTNFRRYAPGFSEEVKDFFKSCGIDDLNDVLLLSPFYEENSYSFGDGMYPVVGSMRHVYRSGLDENTSGGIDQEADQGLMISDDIKFNDSFSICFRNKCDLCFDGFPQKRIQLSIFWRVPWDGE